jgi:hypothetical protein
MRTAFDPTLGDLFDEADPVVALGQLVAKDLFHAAGHKYVAATVEQPPPRRVHGRGRHGLPGDRRRPSGGRSRNRHICGRRRDGVFEPEIRGGAIARQRFGGRNAIDVCRAVGRCRALASGPPRRGDVGSRGFSGGSVGTTEQDLRKKSE